MTENGLWMSHVLLNDGDTWNKQQLLVAVLGALDPTVWPAAAAAATRRAETLGQFRSYAETEQRVRSRAPRSGSAARAAAVFAQSSAHAARPEPTPA